MGLDSHNLEYLTRGLEFGLVGVGLGAILPSTRRHALTWAMAGGGVAAATFVRHPAVLLAGVLAGIAAGLSDSPLPRRIALVTSGLLFGASVGTRKRRGPISHSVGVALMTPIAAIAVERFAARANRWEPAIYAAVALGGVWATVPDTEMPLLVAGAALPGLALSVLWPDAIPSGAAGFAGLLLWAAAVGARGRPSAFVAAVGCLGLLLVGPVADWARAQVGRGLVHVPDRALRPLRFVLHLAVVGVCARVAGPLVSTAAVAIVTGAALSGAMVVTFLTAPGRGQAVVQAPADA